MHKVSVQAPAKAGLPGGTVTLQLLLLAAYIICVQWPYLLTGAQLEPVFSCVRAAYAGYL